MYDYILSISSKHNANIYHGRVNILSLKPILSLITFIPNDLSFNDLFNVLAFELEYLTSINFIFFLDSKTISISSLENSYGL
jgi:hypothetical protein